MTSSTGNLTDLTESDFDSAVCRGGLVIVDFWAEWCQPCRMRAPTIERLAERYADRATLAKLDIEQAQSLAAKYQVSSIPSVLLFKDGEIVDRTVGLMSEDQIAERIERHL